jgi:transcription elongation GreA/GreB family factor
MDKKDLLQHIISKLEEDHRLLLQAAKSAHAAATHEENIPDDKYETLALEASYIAQGQANRAQDIGAAINKYKQLLLQNFDEDTPIRLSALVQLETSDGVLKLVFLGPDAGGLQIEHQGHSIRIVTPESPLGRVLIGRCCGDDVSLNNNSNIEYDIIAVW